MSPFVTADAWGTDMRLVKIGYYIISRIQTNKRNFQREKVEEL